MNNRAFHAVALHAPRDFFGDEFEPRPDVRRAVEVALESYGVSHRLRFVVLSVKRHGRIFLAPRRLRQRFSVLAEAAD